MQCILGNVREPSPCSNNYMSCFLTHLFVICIIIGIIGIGLYKPHPPLFVDGELEKKLNSVRSLQFQHNDINVDQKTSTGNRTSLHLSAATGTAAIGTAKARATAVIGTDRATGSFKHAQATGPAFTFKLLQVQLQQQRLYLQLQLELSRL